MSDAIEVNRLVVDRGGRQVLHEVSFTVRRGSVTGLLGPNGSGKTTLMRCIVGVQKVRAGEVQVLVSRRARRRCGAGSVTSPRRRACTPTRRSGRTPAISPRCTGFPGRRPTPR